MLRLVSTVHGQPLTKQYKHFLINHSKLREVNYHILSKDSSIKKPVLLWLDGSGCIPLRTVVEDTKKSRYTLSSIMIKADSLADFFHVVLISKPGIPFTDTVHVESLQTFDYGKFAETKYVDQQCGRSYNDRASLNWRAEAAALVLDDLHNKVNIDQKRIIVAGHSEGAPVAAKVATLSPHVTHVGCFSGPGLSQLYDFVIGPRKQVLTGELTAEQAQAKIDSNLVIFREIV
ncbi:hypothetical protein [Fibrisoma limi]|uniref:hypothetical protein n=1 Tax=Fibrisoma limi TaxID=663275 RepID=UPI001788BEC6|nr:hypothetical protein [Fibrisoma limi]